MANKYKQGKYRLSVAGNKDLQNKPVAIYDPEGNDVLDNIGTSYDGLTNKPTINGVELEGNMKFVDIVDGLAFGGVVYYNDVLTPDTSCYYIANGTGTYASFGNVQVYSSERVQMLYYDNTQEAWMVDDLPWYNYNYIHGKVDEFMDLQGLIPSDADPDTNLLATENFVHDAKAFKGWFDSSSDLTTAYPSPVVGDFAYVHDASPATTVSIYRCATAGTWADSGNDVDTSLVQTFASSQPLNEVHIVNNLTTGGDDDVLSAEQGKVIGERIKPSEEIMIDYSTYFTIQNTTINCNSGNTNTTNGSSATPLIPIDTLDGKVKYYAANNYNSAGIAFYDASETYVAYPSVQDGIGKNEEKTIQIPTGAKYFRACGKSGAYVKYNSNEGEILRRISDLEDFVDNYSVVDNLSSNDATKPLSAKQGNILNNEVFAVEIAPTITEEDYYIADDLTKTSQNLWKYSKFTVSDNNLVIVYGGNPGNNRFKLIFVKTVNGVESVVKIVNSKVGINSTGTIIAVVPTGATAMYVNCVKVASQGVVTLKCHLISVSNFATSYDIETINGEITIINDRLDNQMFSPDFIADMNPLEAIKETSGTVATFHKIASMGGSTSAGWIKNSVNSNMYDYAYIACIGRVCNSDYENFGRGGLSAYSWLTTTDVGAKSSKWINDTARNLYIVQFGANDIQVPYTDPTYSLGSISDVKVGYEWDCPNTFYGKMAQVIAEIKKKDPRCKIFLVNYSSGYKESPTFNVMNAARELPSVYSNVFGIDVNTYGKPIQWYKDNTGWEGEHPVAAGYQIFAYELMTYIDWIVKKNNKKFYDTPLIGTDADLNGDLLASDGGGTLSCYQVSGTITHNGSGVSDAEITFVGSNSQKNYYANEFYCHTDSNGDYTMKHMPTDTYTMRVHKEGLTDYVDTTVVITNASITKNVSMEVS